MAYVHEHALQKAVAAIEREASSLRQTGTLPEPISTKRLRPIWKTKKHEDGTSTTQIVELAQEEVADHFRASQVLQNACMELPEVRSLIANCEAGGTEKQIVYQAVRSLAHSSAWGVVLGHGMSEGEIQRFREITSNNRVHHSTLLWLEKVALTCGGVDLELDDCTITLRKPTTEDFRILTQWLGRVQDKRYLPPAVVEVRSAGTNDFGARHQRIAWAAERCLRLFRARGVGQFLSVWSVEEWPGVWPDRLIADLPPMPRREYWFRSADVGRFRGFVAHFHPLLLKMDTSEAPMPEPVRRALKRYRDAAERWECRTDPVAGVCHTVRGLEALLAQGKNCKKAQIKANIGALQSDLGIKGANIDEFAGAAYDLRSCEVHEDSLGAATLKEQMAKLEELEGGPYGLLDLLRRCICLFILLGMPKDSFVDMLRKKADSGYTKDYDMRLCAVREALTTVFDSQELPGTVPPA